MHALRADHAVNRSNISIEGITGCELRTLKGQSAEVVSVAFSSDGKTLARGSFDHTIKLWGVASGGECVRLKAIRLKINH